MVLANSKTGVTQLTDEPINVVELVILFVMVFDSIFKLVATTR